MERVEMKQAKMLRRMVVGTSYKCQIQFQFQLKISHQTRRMNVSMCGGNIIVKPFGTHSKFAQLLFKL